MLATARGTADVFTEEASEGQRAQSGSWGHTAGRRQGDCQTYLVHLQEKHGEMHKAPEWVFFFFVPLDLEDSL